MTRILICLLFACSVLSSAEDISGFWKTLDNAGKPQSVIAVYQYEGLHYGRIIGSYDESGNMTDSINNPVKRAPGVVGEPFYSGMDIIWWLVDSGVKFKGKILDPEHGDVYKSELWMDGSHLIVRGKLLIFGRSMTWYPATEADFPKGFKMPDLKKLVPAIPEVK